ncbi:MAG TPA: class I SAM-dependent methyltransferase [Bacteroidales bacterium]|nr:class I SAM-dependent methyltransferase [Bacteroidales bacterium]
MTAGHRKGYGIHSPFMFRFVSEVIYGNIESDRLGKVIRWHSSLKKDSLVLGSGHHGAGSHAGKSGSRRLSHFARHSSVRVKYGRLLYRMADYFRPGEILELGTGAGISTAYLAAAVPNTKIISVEGEADRSQYAQQSFNDMHFPEVHFVTDDFDNFLSTYQPSGNPWLVFIDGNHSYDATLRYCHKLFEQAKHDSVFIIDDIHWSKGMERAWQEIAADPAAVLSVDLFFMGIIFFREGVVRQDFIINF